MAEEEWTVGKESQGVDGNNTWGLQSKSPLLNPGKDTGVVPRD